jgi:transposase-like protein
MSVRMPDESSFLDISMEKLLTIARKNSLPYAEKNCLPRLGRYPYRLAIKTPYRLQAARLKARSVIEQLRFMKLKEAAAIIESGIEETLTYMDKPFPFEHWVRIRTNNALERLNREIKRRTRVVGTFPDGESALMLVAARCKHVAESQWGQRRYLDISRMEELETDQLSLAG